MKLIAAICLSVLTACGESGPELRSARLGAAACGFGDVGVELGELVEDFSLMNQNGDSVLLSDYCGKVVYLQFGAMWCPTCRAEAQKFEAYRERFEADGLVILNLITETPQGAAPKSTDLDSWAVTFDLSIPVLADVDWQIWDRYFPVHSTPRAMLVDRQGRIQLLDYVISEETLAEAVSQ